MSAEQPPGPDRETLKKLHEVMPSFIDAMAKKKLSGKGRVVSAPRFTKICSVCASLHTKKTLPANEEIIPESEICADCQAELAKGMIAVVSTTGSAFISSQHMPDKAGQIMHVSPKVMEAVARECKNIEIRKRNGTSEPRDN